MIMSFVRLPSFRHVAVSKVPCACDPLCTHAGAMTGFSIVLKGRSGLQGFWTLCYGFPRKTACAPEALPS